MMQVVFQLFVCFGISNLKDRNLALKFCLMLQHYQILCQTFLSLNNPNGNRKASDTITLKTSPPVSIKHETYLNNLLF